MRQFKRIMFCALPVFVALQTTCQAEGVQFTKILDNRGTFSGFQFTTVGVFPDINNAGLVTFVGETTSGIEGVFLADVSSPGVPISLLVDNSGVYDGFLNSGVGVNAINDHGLISVTAKRDDGETEIFTITAAGAITAIADTTSRFKGLNGVTDINNEGTVAFLAHLDSAGSDDPQGIYTATGETPLNTVTTIEETGGPYRRFWLPWINDSDNVLFFGFPSDGGNSQVILHRADGHRDIVVETNEGGPLSLGLLYDLSNRSDVAYFVEEVATGIRSIRLYNSDDMSTSIVTTSAEIPALEGIIEPRLNDNRVIAFSDNRRGDPSAIYVAVDGLVKPVLETGDPLFDGVFSYGNVGRRINNSNQLVFSYVQGEETFGLAVATIPEPSTWVMLLAIAATAMYVAGRKREEMAT